VVLDDEQHVEPAQEDGVDVEEIDRGDCPGLGRNCFQLAGARCGAGSMLAAWRISQMVEGAILWPGARLAADPAGDPEPE
jgi:hypothetical protein